MTRSNLIRSLCAAMLFVVACTTIQAQERFTREDHLRRRELDKKSLLIAKAATRHRPELVLQVGDTLKPIALEMAGLGHSELNTAALRGRYVILCFWNTHCSSCLEAFEHMETLRQEYADRLTILPVTFEVKESVEWFFERRSKMGKPMHMPSVVADSLLRQSFPHAGDPYDVWIDPSGVVKHMGGAALFTERNLLEFFGEN